MLEMLNRARETPECLHHELVTVVSIGMERVICESCGHVSFRYLGELSGNIDRSRFGRQVDRAAISY